MKKEVEQILYSYNMDYTSAEEGTAEIMNLLAAAEDRGEIMHQGWEHD